MKFKGIAFTILSTLLFGITPILASATYTLGSTPETLTFYRNALALDGIQLSRLFVLTFCPGLVISMLLSDFQHFCLCYCYELPQALLLVLH